MEKHHYILRKNGEVIGRVENYKEMRAMIPDTHRQHNGDEYDYIHISENEHEITISSKKDAFNSFSVRYEDLNGGELSSVTVSKKDLGSLLQNIGFNSNIPKSSTQSHPSSST